MSDAAEIELLFTHPLQVQVLRFPATLGVRFKYALSAELNLKDLLTWKPLGVAASAAKRSGLTFAGMLI
jgi:hypothetical protein